MSKYVSTSISLEDEKLEAFKQRVEEIGEILGTTGFSETIRELVDTFERINFESKMYRKFIKDARAYEALYKEEHGGGSQHGRRFRI
ncbi:MAG: hypothetical protein HXS46_19170 [Theionarchaea archaeon]|nr:hypothetical protein [Theionarchaea archaeon]